jgi:polyhydroxyalkanoate synthesis repressor PhaR
MRFTRQPPRLIKKYPNRRLYDTTDSTYITLDELAQRVREGADVRIVDASNGEDLTQQTLAQLLFDGRGAARFLSASLLTQLVRLGDDALADFLGRYLSASLELYVQSRRGAQALAPLNPFASLPFAATETLARLLTQALPWGGAPPQPWPAQVGYAGAPAPSGYYPSPPPDALSTEAVVIEPALERGPGDTERELDALRRELAALKAEVRGSEPPAAAHRAAPREASPKTPRAAAKKTAVSPKKRGK